jgi:hypothetical protein
MNAAIKRRKYKEPECMIPVGYVPEWMLGKPLAEWLISQLPEEEAAPMLAKIKKWREEKELGNGGSKALT